jgi:hypothetical protein
MKSGASRSTLIVLEQMTIVDDDDRWIGGYKAVDEVWVREGVN